MAQPAAAQDRPHLTLPLLEARTRFVQLVRLAHLSQQVVTVTDAGRPLAVIAPLDAINADTAGGTASASADSAAAGWARRINQIRADMRRQHASRIQELQHALDQAWRELDLLKAPGTDRHLDALRVMHSDLRRPA